MKAMQGKSTERINSNLMMNDKSIRAATPHVIFAKDLRQELKIEGPQEPVFEVNDSPLQITKTPASRKDTWKVPKVSKSKGIKKKAKAQASPNVRPEPARKA